MQIACGVILTLTGAAAALSLAPVTHVPAFEPDDGRRIQKFVVQELITKSSAETWSAT